MLKSPIKHLEKIQSKLDKSGNSKLLRLCWDAGDGECITQYFSYCCGKAQWRECRGTGIQYKTMSSEGRQFFLHLNAPMSGFYHEVVLLLGSLSNRISFPDFSCKITLKTGVLFLSGVKENDAWFYWNQPRVVFIIENIQFSWTSHKKPGRYNCSSSKCSIDTFVQHVALSLEHKHPLLILIIFTVLLFCVFLNPEELSFPTLMLWAENKPLSKGFPLTLCLEAWG